MASLESTDREVQLRALAALRDQLQVTRLRYEDKIREIEIDHKALILEYQDTIRAMRERLVN